MRAASFATYQLNSIRSYADENIAAGRWPAAGALERSRSDFIALLPQGLATPDNFLYEIQSQLDPAETTGGIHVGYLWFAVVVKNDERSGYVYDLEVFPEYRRQGHAERAFAAMETVAREMRLPGVGLHVFANNPGAQNLYAKLGYRVTGLNMVKHFS